VSAYRRRIFWGHSLAQALAKASRYYGVPVDRLAYSLHEKRHGFVRLPRAVLVEIDPEHPTLPEGTPPVAAPVPKREGGAPVARQRTDRRPPPQHARPVAAETVQREESWDAPDEESIYAAAEAAGRMLQFAGLELTARVEIRDERLEVTLEGADEERLRHHGIALLDDLESLLPRAIMGLSGRHVRCRIEGAGLRARHEDGLRARAREVAERVRTSGNEELLEPLNPAERRIVHLELRDQPGLRTESVGRGFRKRVAISPA